LQYLSQRLFMLKLICYQLSVLAVQVGTQQRCCVTCQQSLRASTAHVCMWRQQLMHSVGRKQWRQRRHIKQTWVAHNSYGHPEQDKHRLVLMPQHASISGSQHIF
jgi:hypothetical protein